MTLVYLTPSVLLHIEPSLLDRWTRLIHLIHRPYQVLHYIDDGMTASSLQEPFKEEDSLLKRTGRTEQPGGMESLMYHHIKDLTLMSPFKPKAKFPLTRSQKTHHSEAPNLLSSPKKNGCTLWAYAPI
jgi:hypothetical protein